MLAASLSFPASAGSGGGLGDEPQIRGSYCDGSNDDLAPSRAGCARIKGYIAAGERFGSGGRIGGLSSAFAPINDPGIVGSRSSFGFIVIGAPVGGDRTLAPTTSGDIAR